MIQFSGLKKNVLDDINSISWLSPIVQCLDVVFGELNTLSALKLYLSNKELSIEQYLFFAQVGLDKKTKYSPN